LPLVHTLLQIPIATPHLAMAVVLLNLISPSGLIARAVHHAGLISAPAGFPALIADRFGAGIVLGYTLKETPFIALMCAAVLARTEREYEMVARTLGASAWQRFRHVTLPLAAPALVSASLVVMAFVFGAFEVPYLLGRPYPAMLGVLAQRRFASIDLADRAAAMAVAIVVSMLTAAVVWLYLRLSRIVIGTEEPTIF
jgi:putative spermidine/putrescine transport system permease protein